MKHSGIRVGKTYRNRKAGTTTRKVIAIGYDHVPEKYLGYRIRNEPGVLFEQNGEKRKLYLTAFAAWCGSEVEVSTS